MNIKQLEYLFSNINLWINNADTKINIFIGVQLAVVGLLIKDFSGWYTEHFFTMTVNELLISIIAISATLLSIFSSIRGIFPSLKSRGKNGELVYFGAVVRHTLEEYRNIVSNSSEKEYKNDLVEQIFTNSNIASQKFLQYKHAIVLFGTGIFLLIFLYFAVK